MHFLLVLALAAASVEGVVTSDGGLLPGCTVALKAAASKHTLVTDAEGRYRFEGVQPGPYELLFELGGLKSARRSIVVAEGVNAQPREDLPVDAIPETITLSCGGPPCHDRAPQTMWDLPTCDDYAFDEALIQSMERGDRSAIELARARYERAATYVQKHLLAGALLGRVADDSAYWSELFEHAHNSVRFSEHDEDSEEYRQWCAERGYDPDAYESMSRDAFWIAFEDRRSRPLLLEALERDVPSLIDSAILGLALHGDLSDLHAIASALERNRGNPVHASGLLYFRHEQADQLALRYLTGNERQWYIRDRDLPPEK